MRIPTRTLVFCGILGIGLATAHLPDARTVSAQTGRDGSDDLVARMMAFDKDGDSQLMKTEVTDERLHRLFDRADADKDGTVTKEELAALAAKESSSGRGGRRGFGPPGGGPGGPMAGMPRLGEVFLPPIVQARLNLSSVQKTQLANLQRDVEGRLNKILNDEQKAQLKEMRDRAPAGRPGGPGFRRGGGRPGFGAPPGPGGPPGDGPPGPGGPPPDGPR
jgi:hypothetical protein